MTGLVYQNCSSQAVQQMLPPIHLLCCRHSKRIHIRISTKKNPIEIVYRVRRVPQAARASDGAQPNQAGWKMLSINPTLLSREFRRRNNLHG